MKQKYTNYVKSGVLAMTILLLSIGPTMASQIVINTNPSGATVTMAYTGQNLGATPLTIDPSAFASPTLLILSAPGYQSINVPIYSWMMTSLAYNLKPLLTSTQPPTSTPVPTSASIPTATPAPTETPAPTPIPTSTSGTLLINSNPTGATVTMAYTGQYLGATPLTIDPSAFASPTLLRLSAPGYQSINVPIYSWMMTSLAYNLKPLSTPAPAPAPAPIPASAPAPAPAPASKLIIETEPEEGANCYYYGGVNHDKYIGTTPFPMPYMDPNGGRVFIKCQKPGYYDAVAGIDPSWSNYPYTVIMLNKL